MYEYRISAGGKRHQASRWVRVVGRWEEEGCSDDCGLDLRLTRQAKARQGKARQGKAREGEFVFFPGADADADHLHLYVHVDDI